jgi:hypothetical protein
MAIPTTTSGSPTTMTTMTSSVTTEALIAFLLEHGAAEERRGYGHISADELAELLLEHFAITPRDDA